MPVALRLLRATQLIWKRHSPQGARSFTTVDLNLGTSPLWIYGTKTVQRPVPLSAAFCREFPSETHFSLDSQSEEI